MTIFKSASSMADFMREQLKYALWYEVKKNGNPNLAEKLKALGYESLLAEFTE